MKQIHDVLRVGFEPGTHGLEVQHPNHSATLPPLHKVKLQFLSPAIMDVSFAVDEIEERDN